MLQSFGGYNTNYNYLFPSPWQGIYGSYPTSGGFVGTILKL
jgi:hypothetical protein